MNATQQPTRSVLLVIDMENDFLPGGALAVPDGDAVIPVINRVMPLFPLVVATRDWHPPGHISFASRHEGKEPGQTAEVAYGEQVMWPEHCVQATHGAMFPEELDQRPFNLILHKGTRKDLDSYSAFFENDRTTSTGLEAYLAGMGVEKVFVCGLAEDVCVSFTAQDARRLGFETFVIQDATRGVDIPEGNLEEARQTMREKGVKRVSSQEVQEMAE